MSEPLEEFGNNLFNALDAYKERTSGHYSLTVMRSFVDDEPIDGCTSQHYGPQIKIVLILTDMKRSDEFVTAYYGDHEPIEIPCLNQTVREIKNYLGVSDRA